MYPLKFTKVLKEKVWGGREFEESFGTPLLPGKTYGESWEVSAHPHGPSRVAEGPWAGLSLPELVDREGPRLLGRAVYDRFGGQFPLLIKYLDIRDKLSIQVHPGDDYARTHGGGFGKSECWYVLKASPDAQVILGTAPEVTKETFTERSARGAWDGLFREVRVTAGDFIHITPGTVHASLAGTVLICEIQQNSDTTFRIYDFDRLDNGVKRDLHLAQALEVMDFTGVPQVSRAGTRRRNSQGGAWVEPLVASSYFTVDRIEVDGTHTEASEDRFRILSVIGGTGSIVHGSQGYPVTPGETWFLPAGLAVTLAGRFEVLRSVV